MSLRRFNNIALRIAQELVARLASQLPKGLASQLGALRRLALPKQLGRAAPLSRSFVARVFQRAARHGRLFVRPLATTFHHQHLLLNRRRLELQHETRRARFRVDRRPAGGVFGRVRGLFGTNARYNRALDSVGMPDTLDGYDIGAHIACGCNAAIYALRLAADGDAPPERRWLHEPHADYPLALKVMFNYHFELPERHLWAEMGAEMIPLEARHLPRQALQAGRMANFKPLQRQHPNVIKMHTAFVDRMPLLPDAQALYPEALPTPEECAASGREPKTLFVVMKRYRLTLRDYVLTHPRNYWVGRVLYGQLLEAVVFLQQQRIAHRDMKSDNVLLDYDVEGDVPHLVLSDFGAALTGELTLAHVDEYADLGGNVCLRAPEVRRSRPGPCAVVDFAMADTWAAGTLGYEIFTRANPFYAHLSSETYTQQQLPPLPRRLHYAVKDVTYAMLAVERVRRPAPQVCANVVCLSLFRFGQDVRAFLEQCGVGDCWRGGVDGLTGALSATLRQLGVRLERQLDRVAELYAAETISANLIHPAVISSAELQLRATFLARVDRAELWAALRYFYDDQSYAAHQCASGSHSSGAAPPPVDGAFSSAECP